MAPIPSSSKFQLPALDISTSSLTAGTSIPPPPPSPPRKASPQLFSNNRDHRPSNLPLKTAYSSSHLRDLSPGAAPSPTDSPNPLRSHPTSSHSLGRKFSGSPLVSSQDRLGNGSTPTTATNNNTNTLNGHSSGNGIPFIPVTHSPDLPRTPDEYKRAALASASATYSASASASTAASPAHHHASPSLHRPATNASSTTTSAPSSTSPPAAKRPLSVRKLLSLRALNSAFGRRDSSEGARSSTPGPGDGMQGYYANAQGKKSSDNLSVFSFATAGTGASGATAQTQPNRSLRKRRSSAFWGRRGSSFLGLAVEEEGNGAGNNAGGNGGVGGEEGGTDGMDLDAPPRRNTTPPPMLPDVDVLEKGAGAKESDGGFLGGGDMFKDIR